MNNKPAKQNEDSLKSWINIHTALNELNWTDLTPWPMQISNQYNNNFYSPLHYITLHRNYLKSPMVKNC